MSELKPCPFCGGEPERRKILGVHHIACKSCGSASSGDKYLPGTEHTWNNRPAPKLPEDTERHQVQMAGISSAAFGYAGDCKKGDYGWAVALDDVKELYRKYSECREQAHPRPTPKLPEGYRVEGRKLYFKNELIAKYDPEFLPNVGLTFHGGYENGEACMDVKHAIALSVFLQGAR